MTSPPEELADGQWLPLRLARKWLGGCGVATKIFRGCRLVGAKDIHIGSHSQIDEGVRIFAGDGVRIGRYVHLAFGSSISGGGRCIIHDFVGVGAGVRLVTGTDLTDGQGLTNPTVPEEFRRVRRGQLEIGDHAVIFTNSVVFPDVVIAEGAVVAAGSVVHRDLKPWCIYAGNPLTQIGVRRKEAVLRLASQLLEAGSRS